MLIEIKNIYKIYNEGKESEVRALDGVTLSIDRGEFVAIIGASGSGKSTLMNILGCLDVPTYGDYILNGADVPDRTARQRVGMADRFGHRPSEMSGGQQQRVAIARAIATHPPIIMADEPTGALDSKTGKHVLEILHSLHEGGSTIILITHDNGIAATAHRIVRISDGRIVADGTREEVGL